MEKILVIDDEKPTLSMFGLFLGAYGYEVFTAENGSEGIELFIKERPPIVLTDIKMPGMDGLTVLKEIKKIDPKTQVIVITGHGDMELAKQALDSDAVGFINKPIKKEALDEALNKARERLNLKKTNSEA
jgi:YesN/AraC family two-component response regulator